ncbi:MAG: hypothetical protein L0207_06080 [Chlamydiae bacterium]|nr:hypothetical protein [Chlamydiota bacterium]
MEIVLHVDEKIPCYPLLQESERELLYLNGYNFYEIGDYQKSSLFFMRLVLADPLEKKYWKGFASSRQMEKKYEEATHGWACYSFLDPENPIAHIHAAECFLSLEENIEAKKALSCAENLPLNEDLKKRVDSLKELINASQL